MNIGSLWKGTDKNGNPYLSGEIDLIFTKLRIGVFVNTNKEGNQPDYRIVKLEDRKQEGQSNGDSEIESPF